MVPGRVTFNLGPVSLKVGPTHWIVPFNVGLYLG